METNSRLTTHHLDNSNGIKGPGHEWSKSTPFVDVSLGANYAQLSIHQEPSRSEPFYQREEFDHAEEAAPASQLDNSQPPTTSSLASSTGDVTFDTNPCTMLPSQMTFDDHSFDNPYSTRSSGSDTRKNKSELSSFSRSVTESDRSMPPSFPSSFIPVEDEGPAKRRSIANDAIDSDLVGSPSASTRGRRSSNTEAGTARAVYLEKNRHAARKCRTKQKRHQEDLVEAARNMERRNKQLKAEVEFLKSDMRDLMGMVLQHGTCSDQRLSQYVQREADRLAGSGSLSPVVKSESLGTTLPGDDAY